MLCGGKRAWGGGNEGEGVRNGPVGFEPEPARMEIRYHGQRADIPSRDFLYNRINPGYSLLPQSKIMYNE
jgi:hypothetical protein